jgi:hypothetical protein
MSEEWFRGEAIDVEPARPGSTPAHDIGDGMYLTDSERSARAYAQLRTTDRANQRIYSVKIDRSSLRVLDLTTDPRWQQHVKPVEQLLKLGTANENYGRTFQSFLRTYKIDLYQFDAVIGLDYVRGGRQLSILSKGGRPTQLHVKIRRQFVLLTAPSAVRVSGGRGIVPRIDIKTRAVRIVGGAAPKIRGVGGSVLTIGIDIVLTVIRVWLDRKRIEKEIEEGLAKLQAELDVKLADLKPEIAKWQLKLDKGEKAFANVTIEVHHLKYSVGIPGRGSYVKPEVRLTDVVFTTKVVDLERTFERELHEEGRTPKRKIDQYTRSFEVEVFSQEEVELFRNLSGEYLAYKRKLRMDPTNQVFIEEARRLRDQIVQAFGAAVPEYLFI